MCTKADEVKQQECKRYCRCSTGYTLSGIYPEGERGGSSESESPRQSPRKRPGEHLVGSLPKKAGRPPLHSEIPLPKAPRRPARTSSAIAGDRNGQAMAAPVRDGRKAAAYAGVH